ncbi:PREDICTED: uncharacterized protein LOC106117248 isoform X2 [Papilio xuthus]|uniref:Uncharacterized protein LOC106117248 isoform X2 n=1 Tax=Papilio xuthus TaxID=66420 RepID=A0AAJ6Z7U7_PAPXU|nr:PREDICTED: uncharacterized protein LOC106117248 isoform X2 [Papilio xuthus]
MLAYLCCVLIFLTVHLSTIQCELTPNDVKTVLQQCQKNLNTSHELDKNDKLLLANWTAEFQMKQVNITSHYRLEMTRHREHNFKKVNLNTKIKKWRKSYKYLSNLCDVDNPSDKDTADRCLAEYVRRDNYDSTFERLILLKLDTMSDLLDQMNRCLNELEDCLRSSFSDNLQSIRAVMNILGQCYNRNREN